MGVVELANPSSPTQKYKQKQMYGWKRLGVAEREEGGWGKCRGGWLSTKIGKYVVGFGTHTQMREWFHIQTFLSSLEGRRILGMEVGTHG